MCGRTHGQPGLPITFGYKAAVWAAELDRHLERVAQARPRLQVAQLGGALGTLEFWGDQGPALLDAFAARLGLGVPDMPWITARDRLAEFATLLALVTGTLGEDRQRDLRAAAARARRARRAVHPGTGRQHHHAAQAQPGARRAPRHPRRAASGPMPAPRSRASSRCTSGTAAAGRPSGSWLPEMSLLTAAALGVRRHAARGAAGERRPHARQPRRPARLSRCPSR